MQGWMTFYGFYLPINNRAGLTELVTRIDTEPSKICRADLDKKQVV
ncbi:hypothetical protein SAMN05216167_102721 [Spirosoma endophyticum]|uniref:Uncharacterized protein n=1 Tax=Spirosoma endophyticum TaxID=662367 RepID=A0A1I1N5Y9_9BACT|nr:hypothetical protein SAMN05216167_102721 [Spirosoma endophyticum]